MIAFAPTNASNYARIAPHYARNGGSLGRFLEPLLFK
jgi:hypothetical protein